MSTSIFSVPTYAISTSYNKWDVVSIGNFYYYALSNFTAINFNTELNNGQWGGYIIDNNETKPNFLWVSNYNMQSAFQPKIKKVQFGAGYEQIMPDNINNELMQIDLSFEERSLQEITAILHFLYTRAGTESFIFNLPPPFSRAKRFRCQEFPHVINFYNNHTLKCIFNEAVR